MTVTILAFAQAREIFGFSEMELPASPNQTPREICHHLPVTLLPRGTRVAVDCVYHDWDIPVGGCNEMAIIPPVSGG